MEYSDNYDDPLLAELYDKTETYTDDVDLLRGLIGDSGPWDILECFSGTGRILVPLLKDGHRVTGIEIAPAMTARAAAKIARLEPGARQRAVLRIQDVLDGRWGKDYDLVILGANAFYELPSADSQEKCIRLAREALSSDGRLFVDNDNYRGGWEDGPFGEKRVVFEGRGEDGTYGRQTCESTRFDSQDKVVRMKRTWFTRSSEGVEKTVEYAGRKHPVSAEEVAGWLRTHGFDILHQFGDRQGHQMVHESDRAIFWAKKAR
jgi:SAM-dependent methyltransferase